MKSPDDLVNRNLIFQKESKKGKTDDNQYTEVEIKPSTKKSKTPEITNEFPNLDENFNYLNKKEILDFLKEFSSDAEIIDEDLEEDLQEEELDKEEVEKKPSKNTKKPTKPKQTKKEIIEDEEDDEEEPDFVKDDLDDDLDDDDSDYDFDDD